MGRIHLLGANVEGARLTVDKTFFNTGSAVVLLEAFRELRGLFTHYSNCSQIWKTLARPIDSLLAYPGESSMWAGREDSELRRAFRNTINFTKRVLETIKG